jgi:hypothetical protein
LGALKNPSTFRELGRDGTLEVVEEGELEEPERRQAKHHGQERAHVRGDCCWGQNFFLFINNILQYNLIFNHYLKNIINKKKKMLDLKVKFFEVYL